MPRLLAPLAALAAVLLVAPPGALAQPFAVTVTERTDLANAPAVHSGAHAEHDGLWLYVGGRHEGGMHAFTTPSFPREDENASVFVYEHETDERWSASVDDLAPAIAEHLRTTNAQFLSRGDSLIVVGGYGYRAADEGFVTFGTMTVLDVPEVIAAVVAGESLAEHVRQPIAWDEALTVAGGHLTALGDRLALVGGNRFDGEYGGTAFTQTYTQAIRTFEVDGSAGLVDVQEVTDPELHRRDGNIGPAVLDDGSLGLGIYGGVFHPTTQGAYLRPIRVTEAGALDLEPTFEQHVGHYTSPVLPLYDSEAGAMHTVFVGGINGFIWNADTEDWQSVGTPPFLPFTDDIAVLSREGGEWSEHYLGDLPSLDGYDGLLGTNAALFLAPDLPMHTEGIVDLDALPAGETLLGWVLGGIEARQPSFGTTSASARVLEVSLLRAIPPATEDPAGLAFAVGEPAPNPSAGPVRLALSLDRPEAVRAEVLDLTGRRVALLHDGPLAAGPHTLTWAAEAAPGLYLVRVTGADGRGASRRVVLAR